MGNEDKQAQMRDNMAFENELDEMGEDIVKLTKFVAREVYYTRKDVSNNTKRITVLEKRRIKIIAATTGTGAMIGGFIIALLNYIFKGAPPPTFP